MKKIYFLFLCFFIFPLISHAECSYEDKRMYRNMADNINIIYQVKSTDSKGYPIFEIDITNLARGLMVIDMQTGIRYQIKDRDGYNLSISNITTSGEYELKVYTDKNATECGVIDLRTLTIKLPKYNKYYTREECDGLTSYSVCQRWSGFSGDEKQFQNAIKKAREDKDAVSETYEESKKTTKRVWFSNLTRILIDYWWLILTILVLFFGIYCFFRARYRKKYYSFKL